MAQQWMGFTISIDCGLMGKFQGVVTAVEAAPQSVTLSRVFHNGVPHTSPSIVISAHDIKDLTIIAAPQAQLDPIVELKKPIPTRPGRNVSEGTQNFHSQPAPPRTLHPHTEIGLDPRKAAVLLEYEQRMQKTNEPRVQPPPQTSATLLASSQQATSEQKLQEVADHYKVQLNALQAALPEALKITVTNQAAALASSVIFDQAQGAPKLNAAQTVSHSALQLRPPGKPQAASTAPAVSQGGFKMTAVLQGQSKRVQGQASQLSMPKSLLVKQSTATPGLLHAGSVRGTVGGAPVLKGGQASATKPPQASALKGLQMNTSEPLPLASAAQAFFRGAASQMSSQGACALARPQGAAAQGSPQKNSRGLHQGFQQAAASLNSLHVNADGYASGSGDGNRTPNRRDRLRQRWQARDEACFGSPSNNGFDQEFDFEKNLALFDKQAVYDEIAIQRPDLVQPANDQRRQQNYRHDQNVIVNNRRIPAIIVPNPGSAEYVTDEGLIIPSMRPELLRQLHQKAHDVGFTHDRQSELFARCSTEMSLQLLGGAHRLNPHNAHQWPTVIIMVGPHSQGAAGVMCARQLECQGVSTVTLVVNEAAAPQMMKRELNFYKCGGAPIVHSTDQLPETVDLVIMALAGHLPSDVANSLEYGKAASWASNKRAPVLALDPPPVGTPGIITKFALAPTLPLTYSPQNGKIYLCNLGIPVVVFKEMGIRYRSPFGSKFVIPLHPNDE